MARYLKVDELIERKRKSLVVLKKSGRLPEIQRRNYELIEYLLKLPTVDAVEVVHGEWINLSDTYTWFRCSVCEKYQGVTHNYCPNCGAKMDGDQEK